MAESNVSVYRLKYVTGGQEITPAHMWGTVAAIERLGNCIPVLASERRVTADLLDEHGFLFEHTASVYVTLEEISPRAAA
jgi:hypothetical protein